MANRFFNPDEQFCDTTGLPYAGGSLTFQASGTSTPLATYSDRALTIANTNPVVLDSAGRAGTVFLQNLAYKVILADVNNNTIWTADPVYSSDFSTTASFLSGAGSPNGNTAGSQGTPTVPASVYWDNINNILYVCTQTGTTSTAVWTAVNAASAQAVILPPQGYLTPTSGTPIIPSDVTGSTSLVYTPYVGNLVPIYTGTSFNPTVFSELTLTLTTSQASNTIYDVFVFNNSGVLTLATGPAWSNSAAASGARGTGAGTTQISRLSGIWVNTVSMTGRNSSNTYAIPANQGTYLGSIFIDGTAGQISLYVSYGQSRKWAIWNAYNRQPINMQAGDSTTSWTYNTTNVPRPSNNSSSNTITTFVGLPEEPILVTFNQLVTGSLAGASDSATWKVGVGWNNTNGFSGMVMTGSISAGAASNSVGNSITGPATYSAPPAIGINSAFSVEDTTAATGASVTYSGTSSNMKLTTSYRG